MQKHTVLILDESDVVESKRNLNASEITREDLLMPAYFDYVGAEVVVLKINNSENVMKTKRERQFLQYIINKGLRKK